MATKQEEKQLTKDQLIEKQVFVKDRDSFINAMAQSNPIEKMMCARLFGETEYMFWTQYVIDLPEGTIANGRKFFIADFYIPNLELVIETDGRQHFSDSVQISKDHTRLNVLTSMGFRLLRFDWDEVMKPNDQWDVLGFVRDVEVSVEDYKYQIIEENDNQRAEIDEYFAQKEKKEEMKKTPKKTVKGKK